LPGEAIRLVATAFTHEGALRPTNQDCIAVGDWIESATMAAPRVLELEAEGSVLALVADGMGGHAAGEISSRAAAEYLVSQAARATDAQEVERILNEAHVEQFALMREQPRLLGMGSTVAGMFAAPSGVIVFNAGDSRVYRIGAHGLVQLSTDDTPGPKLADGRTAAHTTPIITQTLGGAYAPNEIEPHLLAEPLEEGARYLVCSDGLTDLLDLAEIEAELEEEDEASVGALFQAAMARGGRDNVSIIIVRLYQGRTGC
jgi:serine/threonine protein phosphatase PrpC